MKDNFIEVKSVEEANKIDMNQYTFLERFSSTHGSFIFKIREIKR
jgi:hypothetical protein